MKAAALSVRDGTVKVSGTIGDPTKILDAFLFVGARKMFFKSNQGAKDPNNMKIDFDAPLRPGVNVITLVARQSSDVVSRRTVIVRRDGVGGELLVTPKDADDDLAASSRPME
jgi:carboxyl-terminal processing protease